MRKLGIYVQVPFCQMKCTYCNFHTGVVASSRFAPYVEAVCREVRGHRELLKAAEVGRGGGLVGQVQSPIRGAQGKQEWLWHEAVVDTVYFGGGTPSLLDPTHLKDMLDAIRETFNSRSEGDGHGGRKSGGGPPHSKVPASLRGAEQDGGPRRCERPPVPEGEERTASEDRPHNGELEEGTLEGDPGTVEGEKAAAWVEAGDN